METPSYETETAQTALFGRKRGRPPLLRNREVDKKAEELAAKHAVPQPPAKTLSWDQMQEYFKLFTPEMWSHVAIYVYRIKPRIIRQLKNPNAKNHIDNLSQPITQEYMIDRHGGGKYQFECVDIGAPRSESNYLFRCIHEIDEVRYHPKLDYEELDLNHRENMSYVAMLRNDGVIDDKGKVINNQSNQAPQNGGLNSDVLKEVLSLVRTLTSEQQEAFRSRIAGSEKDGLTKSVGDILLEKMKQEDPSKHVAMLSGLLTALKEIVGTSKQTDNTAMFAPVFQMLSKQNETLLGLLNDRRQEPAAQESNRIGDLKELLSLALQVSELRGGGSGRRSAWDIGLDYARELGPALLQPLNTWLATRNGGRLPAGVGVGGVPNQAPASFDPYRNPDLMRQYAAASSVRDQAAAPPPGAAGFGAPPAGAGFTAVVQGYAPLVVNALNNGTPGSDFADYVCGLFGNATHAAIASAGEDTIIQSMMSIPELALFGAPRLKTFTHEFIHFEEIMAEAEKADAHAA